MHALLRVLWKKLKVCIFCFTQKPIYYTVDGHGLAKEDWRLAMANLEVEEEKEHGKE